MTGRPGTVIALVLLGAVLMLAVLGPGLAARPAEAIDLTQRLLPPGPGAWLGTDALGRDMLARVGAGLRLSAAVAIAAVAAATTLGVALGGAAGLAGGVLEAAVLRAMDVIMAMPPFLLALALAASLGPSLANAALALAAVRMPVFVRLAQAQAAALRGRAFAEFARLNGAGPIHVLRHHVLPLAAAPLGVQAAADLGQMVLAAAALGFIGLGAQPPTPELGALVAGGRGYLATQWWLVVFPGAALFALAAGLNLLADALRGEERDGDPHA